MHSIRVFSLNESYCLNVSLPGMNAITTRDQFTPVRYGENSGRTKSQIQVQVVDGVSICDGKEKNTVVH